jgi:hypothetical protein
MTSLSFITTYYNQSDMLKKQIEMWESYSDEIKSKVQFIVVDDGSSKEAMEYIDNPNINLSVYRINEDIYCNIPGAVNLGAKVCETEWMFKHDIDHLIPEESLSLMLNLTDTIGNAYKFYRYNGTEISNANKIAPGQFMIHTSDFWRIGGWDEDFCGNYGQNDPAFFWRAKGIVRVEERYEVEMVIDEEGETSEIDRSKRDVNEKLFEEKKRTGEWSYEFLRFDWEKVY